MGPFHDYDNVNNERLGRWLGPIPRADQEISYRILTDEGKVVSWSSVNHLPSSPINGDDISRRKKYFTNKIESLIGNYSNDTCVNLDEDIDTENIYNTFFDEIDVSTDDDNIEYQDLDTFGKSITRPGIDDYVKLCDPPFRNKVRNKR